MTRLVLPPSLLALQSPETRARLDPVAQLRRDACPPAERAALEEMFKVAVDSGYLPKLPPPTAIYQP